MAAFLRCVVGPRLFRVHCDSSKRARQYEPNLLESGSDKFIKVIRFCWSVTYWTSPIVFIVLYRRGYFTAEGFPGLCTFLGCIGVIYTAAMVTRGIGRFINKDYRDFLGVLTEARKSYTVESRTRLGEFDSEFWAWPTDFRWDEGMTNEKKASRSEKSKSSRVSSPGFSVGQIPCSVLSYIAANTFGRRMVYPGATALMNALLHPMLLQSRAKMIEEKNGTRAKLLTEDNNDIDTMFVDRRNSGTVNGNTLVLCSEGNAGFYEIGCTCTPIEAGYSVLGWNHPGFGGSTGAPTPSQEQYAVDAVMQYALNCLNFVPENIIVYGWSIGGYPTTWAAMSYPDVKYMILDATFDDLLPLAEARMPKSLKTLVVATVKTYLNLNIAENLCRYPGPVLLIRRSKDEMITTQDPAQLHSNRGNNLLIIFLQHRYPNIVDSSTVPVLEQWLKREKHQQAIMWVDHDVEEQLCLTAFRSYIEENSSSFPMHIGSDYDQIRKNQMALYLASKYMEDFDSTHCTPLPTSFFHKPWTPEEDLPS